PPSAGMACRPRAWPAGDAPPARLRTGGAASGWTARATPTRGQAWERKAPLGSFVPGEAFRVFPSPADSPPARRVIRSPTPGVRHGREKHRRTVRPRVVRHLQRRETADRALPRLARAAGSEELSAAFEAHLEETHGQIERIDQIVDLLGIRL